jgi:hypothetical protein
MMNMSGTSLVIRTDEHFVVYITVALFKTCHVIFTFSYNFSNFFSVANRTHSRCVSVACFIFFWISREFLTVSYHMVPKAVFSYRNNAIALDINKNIDFSTTQQRPSKPTRESSTKRVKLNNLQKISSYV